MVNIKLQKRLKKSVTKRRPKFQSYKNCLEASQIENKIYHLEKNIINKNGLKDKKEFIKNNKVILKTQQMFKSFFTEEITKIAFQFK